MSCVYLSPLLTVLLYPPAVSQPRAGTRSCECAFLLTVHTLSLSGVYTRAGSRAAVAARRSPPTPAGPGGAGVRGSK